MWRAAGLAMLFLVLALFPSSASAATVDQIVSLSQAGVSENVILALIDRDKTIFTLDPDQLVALQREGVSESVVLAMLKSGRAEADAAARAETAMRMANIAATSSPAPDVVVVGHEPDAPNAVAGGPMAPGVPVPYPVPYPVVVAPYASGGGRAPHADARRVRPRSSGAPGCVLPATVDQSPTARGIGFMPVCPPR